MELALRTRGMGGPIAQFVDTGGGITPQNWETNCCTNWLDLFDSYDHVDAGDACDLFYQANSPLFAGNSPCSRAALTALSTPPPVQSVAPVPVPPIVTDPGPTYGQAMVPVVSGHTQCDGRLVATAQDATDLQTCLALQQAAAQAAAVQAQMNANAGAQCAAMKAQCAAGLFGSWMVPSADCTGCVMDPTKTGSLPLVLVGIGLVLMFLMGRR